MGYRVTGGGSTRNRGGQFDRVHGGYSTRSEGGQFDTVTDGNITQHEGEQSPGEVRRNIGNPADLI